MSLQILCDTKPTAKGITSQDKITINILAPASNEAIGPTAQQAQNQTKLVSPPI